MRILQCMKQKQPSKCINCKVFGFGRKDIMKKIILISAILVMLVMAGCSNTKKNEESSATTAEPETTTEEPTTTPEPETTTEEPTTTAEPETTTVVYNRDSSCVIKSADGTIEKVIEYDSSVVTYSADGSGTVSFYPVDEQAWGPIGTVTLKSGCASYEAYCDSLMASYKAIGDPEPFISHIENCEINGYKYYFFEGFYKTETDIGDPDIIYVQVGANEYLELYNVWIYSYLEEFVNTALYVK